MSSGINMLERISLRAENLKSFNGRAGFEDIKPFNIIIGRNNVGKSSLIDMVQYAVEGCPDSGLPGYLNKPARLFFETEVTKSFVDNFVPKDRGFMNCTLVEWCFNYILNKELVFSIDNDGDFRAESFNRALSPEHQNSRHNIEFNQIYDFIRSNLGNPFRKHKFRRIVADRDIRREEVGSPDSPLDLLQPDGTNATNLIARYVGQAFLDRNIVETTITNEMNQIFNPDSFFKRIYPRQERDGTWQIYLEEPKKGLIPMSHTGSGVKTVLLVLLNLYLVPDVLLKQNVQNVHVENFMFGFEELENNLHPALLRRLFLYLRDIAQRYLCKFFITTHSHVLIDMFSRDSDAQIVHVTHDGESAKVQAISTYIGHKSIFDDLEVRASDLLQANCVVWVEGPSDRVYFNKWVELWSEGELREHVDYEVGFTSGTLLTHMTYDDPTKETKLIQALKINSNAIVLMDRDKSASEDVKLKDRVERVINEIEQMDGVKWVTQGKEVENYIPKKAFEVFLGELVSEPPEDNTNVFEWIKEKGKGSYSGRKVDLAEKICAVLEKEMIEKHADLGDRLNEVCASIYKWNNRKPLSLNERSSS